MLCMHGKHAVGLRMNTLRTCTEQQTVQGLTHVVTDTHIFQISHKGTTQYKYSISLGYTSSSTDKSVIMITTER